jgi:hypothetical protein
MENAKTKSHGAKIPLIILLSIIVIFVAVLFIRASLS